jgi:hypothetical protein
VKRPKDMNLEALEPRLSLRELACGSVSHDCSHDTEKPPKRLETRQTSPVASVWRAATSPDALPIG